MFLKVTNLGMFEEILTSNKDVFEDFIEFFNCNMSEKMVIDDEYFCDELIFAKELSKQEFANYSGVISLFRHQGKFQNIFSCVYVAIWANGKFVTEHT